MTLLEALVALVILGVAAGASLVALQGSARSARNAEVWAHAAGYAEATMEQTKLATPIDDVAFDDAARAGFGRTIDVRPWPQLQGIDQITVSVSLPGGGNFTLHRLVRSR